MPKRKDIGIIAAVLVAAVLLVAASRLMPAANLSDRTADATLAPDAIEYLQETPGADVSTAAPASTPGQPDAEEPTPDPQPDAADGEGDAVMGPMPAPQTQEVRGYVVITVGGRQYGDPIPMDRDKIITLQQDEETVNKVHITPQTVYMESSTCENQDCVGQGEIDVDTYQSRILGTYIICLPNDVTVELVPAQ